MILQTLWQHLDPAQQNLLYVLGAVSALGFSFQTGALLADAAWEFQGKVFTFSWNMLKKVGEFLWRNL